MKLKLPHLLVLLMVFVSAIASAGPAPALTSNTIVGVGSSHYPIYSLPGYFPPYGGGEGIPLNYYSTVGDHWGPTVQVLTKEVGYADNTRFASLDGRKPTSIATTPIVSFDRRVTGYWVLYTFANVSTVNWAKFTCSATSLVFPWRTYSCFVNIK